MKKFELKKLIKEEIGLLKESQGKYRFIIDFESEQNLGELVRDMKINLKDSYFYSDDFPGRVVDIKITKRN